MEKFHIAAETKDELQERMQELVSKIEFKESKAIMIIGEVMDCICSKININTNEDK